MGRSSGVQNIDGIDLHEIVEMWNALVVEYTKRKLKSEHNRLITFSSIARAMQYVN